MELSYLVHFCLAIWSAILISNDHRNTVIGELYVWSTYEV